MNKEEKNHIPPTHLAGSFVQKSEAQSPDLKSRQGDSEGVGSKVLQMQEGEAEVQPGVAGASGSGISSSNPGPVSC